METRVCLNPDKKGLRRQIQNFSIQLIGEEGCAGLSVSFTLDSAFCHCSWESSVEDGPGAQVITPTGEAWQNCWLD